jgi:putative SOS response-associated peptidase YedK
MGVGAVRPDLETARDMCGRFTSSQRRETIGERFEVTVPEPYQERFNVAPAQRALVVREHGEDREAAMAKWGLLPHWAKDAKVAFKMINARAETLSEKPAYRSLLSRHRCLIVADGFYEWTVGSDGKKHPIHFHLPGYELFGFAGLWTSRTDEATGEILESCTIITTRPNDLVAPVHDRIPVILPREAERVWLDQTISKEHALSLLEPYPAELMLALPASSRANSTRNDDSGLLVPDEALAA